jgi:hypothetical protein
MPLLNGAHQAFGGTGLGQIGWEERDICAIGGKVRGDRFQVGGRPAGQHHVAAVAGEFGGDQRPDAAGGAGD